MKKVILQTLQLGVATLMTITSPLNSQAVLMANVAMPLVETIQVDELKELPVEQLIKQEAKKAGVNADLAVKVAFCESTLRQFDETTGEALRGVHNPQDIGLFQINESYHLDKSKKLGFDIYTTAGNIDYAMYLMKEDGLRHWHYSKPCWGQESEKLAQR